jgi:hypothetical protein
VVAPVVAPVGVDGTVKVLMARAFVFSPPILHSAFTSMIPVTSAGIG